MSTATRLTQAKQLSNQFSCSGGTSAHPEIKNDMEVLSSKNRFPENGLKKLEANEIFERILSLLVSGKDITSVYNVSPRLRGQIDYCVFEDIFFQNDWYLDFDSSKVDSLKKLQFRTVSNVRKAIADSRTILPLHPKGRIIEMQPKYDDDSEIAGRAIKKFHSYARTFLARHGESVWSLLYSAYEAYDDAIYRHLFNWVKKMPNIRALTLESYWLSFFEEDIKEEEERLKTVMARSPFPHIPSLVYLRVNSHLLFPVCAEILRVNSQVKKLHVKIWDKNMEEFLKVRTLLLEGLYFEYFKMNSLECFLRYGKHWPLKKLELHCCRHVDDERLEMQHLASLLSPYTSSLEFLDLSGLNNLVDNGTLNLSRLEVLKVKMNPCLMKIDFIIALKDLQQLRVEIPRDFYWPSTDTKWTIRDASEKIRLKGFLEDFQLSNAWNLLPSLSQVHLKTINVLGDLNIKYERNHAGITKINF